MAFFRLNVPFKDKDIAKSFGARWFSSGKYWYYDGEEIPEGLKKWYEPEEKTGKKDIIRIKHSDGHSRLIDRETGEILENDKESDIKYDIGPSRYDRYRTVSEVNAMISEIIYSTTEFRSIFVKGEITNYDGKKGRHYYFAIKDEGALLPCVMWDSTAEYALKFQLEKGQQVAVSGRLEYYKEGGKTQLIVADIEKIGLGMADMALKQLKLRLQEEGLFDLDRKKAIPKHPATVGIITSMNGQAIKDICKVAKKRNPYVQLILYHVNVQGTNAVDTIVEGIRELDKRKPDSIIVGRGGGSDEELNVYNDERIVRAVSAASTPIVSAVGHEGHWTLIDFVSDKRVATPTEAAEETIPDVMTDMNRVVLLKKMITESMSGILRNRLLLVENRIKSIERNNPEIKLNEKKEKLRHISELIRINMNKSYDSRKDRFYTINEKMNGNIKFVYQRYQNRFEVLLAELTGLSPTAKLVGGFGYITSKGKPVKSVKSVRPGDDISVRIHDGTINAVISE